MVNAEVPLPCCPDDSNLELFTVVEFMGTQQNGRCCVSGVKFRPQYTDVGCASPVDNHRSGQYLLWPADGVIAAPLNARESALLVGLGTGTISGSSAGPVWSLSLVPVPLADLNARLRERGTFALEPTHDRFTLRHIC